MTNETFCLLSEEEKHTKFKATMKGKTRGCLNEVYLESIARYAYFLSKQ